MAGPGLDKLVFLNLNDMTSPDPQPRPPAPDAEVRQAVEIPAAPVASTGISTGSSRPEFGAGVAFSSSSLAAVMSLQAFIFLKTTFAVLQTCLPHAHLSLSHLFHLHSHSPHI